ncbi:hypothetical protein CsSME_00037014 [Camellia sinensis var. sinensis]
MAMMAVKVVLEKLGSLLAEEAQFLGGVGNGVAELRDDLESMRSFLQDAEARSESDKGVKTWVKQVRDVAYNTEDILEEFLLRLSPPQGSGFFHFLHKGYHHLRQLRARHRLAVQIEEVKRKVKAISERRNAFSFKRIEEATTSTATTTLQTWNDPRLASLFLDDTDVVGIENPKSLLISWLVNGEQNLTAVSVVGMGGVGKTTLVKKVYDSQAVKKSFDRHAWITVSQSFTTAELLRATLKGFLEEKQEPIPEGLDTMGEIQLINKLRDYLQQKRYVVVFDDVWNRDAWESVKFALPDCCCGSRIIFTTRIGDVAAAIETAGHVYHLQALPEEEAWTLFCKKAFQGESNGICPKELGEMSYRILNKCGGLPLAIVTIGSLLSKKNKHLLEWKKVHDSLSAEVISNSNFETLKRILLLSYIDLPYHLKCCFLYLSVFPEDYLIKRMKLIRLWVVERFVEEKPGLTAEEVAEDYLNELVSRNMIQVVKKDYFNRVTTCRVHDIMREIIQLKSRDESFAMILMNNRRMSMEEKVRRMSIHGSREEELPSGMRLTSLRSLLVFVSTSSSMSLGKTFFKGFKLLGVLELERAPLYEFPPELTEMIHLRYLSLRWTMINKLPESIGKLKKLEILDLKHCLGTCISSLPNGISKLKNLCQLRGYGYYLESSTTLARTYGMNLPGKIGELTNLQKLGNVDVNGNGDMLREVGKLTQLRRLGILELTQENGMELCSSLEKLKHLTALYMVSISTSEPLHLNSLSSCPEFLQRLYLKSSLLTLPKWIAPLQYLAKLVLQYSNLHDDPLKSLQGLPNLVVLELREAFAGEELCCNIGGYPRLQKLSLHQLSQLKCVRVEQGAMPGLLQLNIVACEKLEAVPMGIEHLRNLCYLVVWRMPRGFYQTIKRSDGEDFWKVQHIETIDAVW